MRRKKKIGLLVIIGVSFFSGMFSMQLLGRLTNEEDSAANNFMTDIAYANTQTHLKISPVPSVLPAVSPMKTILKPSAMLSVNLVSQKPELYNGCEVSSLAMLLQYDGFEVDKMDLINQMKYDPTELETDENGDIISWGNPNTGFVGDITGKEKGYGIYHTALIGLLQDYIPSGIDLTNDDFGVLERQVSDGIPVVVWTTVNYSVPDSWVEWETPLGPFQGTFLEHAVLLVGYDEDNVYINDPLSGASNVKIDKDQFTEVWKAMGSQAISYQKS